MKRLNMTETEIKLENEKLARVSLSIDSSSLHACSLIV